MSLLVVRVPSQGVCTFVAATPPFSPLTSMLAVLDFYRGYVPVETRFVCSSAFISILRVRSSDHCLALSQATSRRLQFCSSSRLLSLKFTLVLVNELFLFICCSQHFVATCYRIILCLAATQVVTVHMLQRTVSNCISSAVEVLALASCIEMDILLRIC